jgi:hypothetical protein
MDLRESGWRSVEWIQLAQNRDWWQAFVNTVMNLLVLAPPSELVSLLVVVHVDVSLNCGHQQPYCSFPR